MQSLLELHMWLRNVIVIADAQYTQYQLKFNITVFILFSGMTKMVISHLQF